MMDLPDWPRSLGSPETSGVIRRCPEDFFVEEIPRVSPTGEGSHLWLWVEKRSANTDWVAGELAKLAGCPHRDVGYAGMKDRHAVTRQWFSLPISDASMHALENIDIEGIQVLESLRHGRKLKRGTLDGNRFRIRIHELQGDVEQTRIRLEQVRETGVPNYFGPQRFGHGGRNLELGLKLLQKGVRLKRNKKSIYLSAIRSFLFNQVLAERVRADTWKTIIDGELAMLDGTQSIFPCTMPDQEIEDRCRCHDIHPTGPLPGENGTQPAGTVAELEQQVMQAWPQLIETLVCQRVQASRRALRLYPAALEWDISADRLELTFELPPGAYATTLLREILVVTEPPRNQDRGL